MITKINIKGFECVFVPFEGSSTLTYFIYPALVPFDDKWIERMSSQLKVSIAVVYVPTDDWNDVLTPWPEPPESKGFPPFGGKAAEFLNLLQNEIVPQIEKMVGKVEFRDLIGVSLAGLFTLWEWLGCNLFRSIASLSGSFWYDGFIEWFSKQTIPEKQGKAYFLLGEDEPKAKIKAYQSVGVNTEKVVEKLKEAGIKVKFEWVPGNHFSKPVHRAEKALHALYG